MVDLQSATWAASALLAAPPLPPPCRSLSTAPHPSAFCRLKGKQPPEGWELIEEVIDDFEQQMKDAVNEDTSGKRRNETTWKVRAPDASFTGLMLPAGHNSGGAADFGCL